MANLILLFFFVLINIISIISVANAISSCNDPCQTFSDGDGHLITFFSTTENGQLICINGKCNDDPSIGTHICGGGSSPPPPPDSSCKDHGTLSCQGISYPAYNCSPQVTSSTPATLALNDFAAGGDGGGPSECDGEYHSNDEKIVELSTGWYDEGSRCGKMIRINATNGRSVTAKVVDECDSMYACPPCKNNRVDGSKSVWTALGLNIDLGLVPVTWSMA